MKLFRLFASARSMIAGAGLGILLLAGVFAPAQAASPEASCKLHFNLHGWSVFYKTASGTGTITCSDGQRLDVKLEATGGGITFGKISIDDGIGKFTGIYDIRETLGSYVMAEAHAGAVESAKAQVMTKGNVALALSGTGKGWNLGVAFGKFEISAR